MPLQRYEKGEGKDWNVKDTIAFGRGDVHKEFQGLQADLNSFASRIGYPKLEIDGFLGPKTVAAITAVYDAVVAKNPLLKATPFPMPKTKEDVAEYAAFIRSWLTTTAREVLDKAGA